jgi:4-carboxymuconolactone decarboxylase
MGEHNMSIQHDMLGGRLPLLDPQALSGAQREVYDYLNKTMIPWADSAHFQSKTVGGRLIGPFNPLLYSPGITLSFVKLQEAEWKYTSLSKRVREVVILTVGAVWQSDYERYAHSAVARTVGLSEEAIRTLVAGGLPEDLNNEEQIAHRYARQLSAEHRVDSDLYSAAEQAFGKQGLVDLTYLTGIYHIVCALINGFETPVPEGQA